MRQLNLPKPDLRRLGLLNAVSDQLAVFIGNLVDSKSESNPGKTTNSKDSKIVLEKFPTKLQYLRSLLLEYSAEATFQLEIASTIFVNVSEGWSHREIIRFINAVKSKVLGSAS
jgi:hypothetical protein